MRDRTVDIEDRLAKVRLCSVEISISVSSEGGPALTVTFEHDLHGIFIEEAIVS